MTIKNKLKIDNNQKSLIERLVLFGFSTAEAEIYVYLLERGVEVGGSKIAVGTSLHRQYIYTALPKLIEQGLVEEISHGKQSKYKARPPQEIEKIGRSLALDASILARDLNLISSIGNDQDFEVIQGARAIQQYEMNYIEQADSSCAEYIIGGASKGFSFVMGDYLDDYLNQKKKKKLNVKYLGSMDEEDSYKNGFGTYNNQEYRFMNRLPKGVAHMVIRKETVSFYSFLTPPLVYIIKSKIVADNYKQFFMMLWEMASEEN